MCEITLEHIKYRPRVGVLIIPEKVNKPGMLKNINDYTSEMLSIY